MNVEACLSKDVRSAAPTETIREAARAMKEIDAGFLPVGENDRLVGMITDRDIAVRGVAEGKAPDTPVSEVMSSDVHYIFAHQSVEDAASRMGQLQVRRLPVLNRDKRLVGIISLGDVSRSNGADDDSCAALKEITEPGGHHTQV